jgi:hypothetical protein
MPRQAPNYARVLSRPETIARFINQRIDSKKRWYRKNRKRFEGRAWPSWQKKVLAILYNANLGIFVPKHGKVLCQEGDALIIRWKSPCPILARCKKQGLATCRVCSTLYHAQYQALLSWIVPGAFFARDYSRLRPEGDACIEVILRRPDVVSLDRDG